jgi:hypothetical protein
MAESTDHPSIALVQSSGNLLFHPDHTSNNNIETFINNTCPIVVDNKNNSQQISDNCIEIDQNFAEEIGNKNNNNIFLQELRMKENSILSSRRIRNVYFSQKSYKSILDNIKSIKMMPYNDIRNIKRKHQCKDKK